MESGTWIKDGLIKPYSIKYTGSNYDIYKDVVSKKRGADNKLTEETYERTKLICSVNTLEAAIEEIIRQRVTAGNKKVTTLIDFYKNLKQIKKEIEDIFKQMSA